MLIKTKFIYIEIEYIVIIIVLTSLLSNTFFNFFYYFFACYLFILFHELMHILVASLLNYDIKKIKIAISGICVNLNTKNKKPLKEILVHMAGPISNLILAYVFKNNEIIKEINIFIAILNLMPIYPLDGYNVLHNILKLFTKNHITISNIASNIFIYILASLSIYQICIYKNISFVIVLIYITVLKLSKKKH